MGREGFDLPLYEICVETGLMRIDVCGKLDNLHIGDVAQFKDDAGNIYNSDEFYLE